MITSARAVAPSATRHLQANGAQEFAVLDVEKLDCLDPLATGIARFTLTGKPKVVRCDVFVAGGGMGGVAAAIRAAQLGMYVCLTEETDWLGGQMTAQGVSALDENCLVETSGSSRLYQSLRSAIRQYYRTIHGASPESADNELLNPGNNWVAYLSFEPQIGVQKLNELIDAAVPARKLTRYMRQKVVALKVVRGRVRSLLTVNLNSGQFTEFRPKFVIDATELGDLLPMAGIPYVSGAESKVQTAEPHAPETANPDNVQDFVYPFVIEFRPGTNNTISKPPEYDQFQNKGKFSFNGYKMFECASVDGADYQYLPFWTYRRLIASENFPASQFKHDIAMINWDSNDLRGENIIDQPLAVQAQRLALAKKLSLGFLYWLQTEAPRDDQGKGYPELYLLSDYLGTSDGLSKYPYIRECRRIKAVQTIVEQDVAAASNSGARARLFNNSVGIGLYPIDIHGYQDVPGAGQASKPFEIPLGALTQTTIRNLVPACKNIGTTHVTNGAYRLHPVEWAIGEAAGTLAGYCLRWRSCPQEVIRNKMKVRTIQNTLVREGTPVFWYDDVPTTHPQFAQIQYLAAAGIMTANRDDLHFLPDQPITRCQAAEVLSLLVQHVHEHKQHTAVCPQATAPAAGTDRLADDETLPIAGCLERGLMKLKPDWLFHGEQPLTADDIDADTLSYFFRHPLECKQTTVTRAEFAAWIYRLAISKRMIGLL